MSHKLNHGVTVQRDCQPVPLLLDSFGSELNQVWTNLSDNTIDVMTAKANFESKHIAIMDELLLRSATTVRGSRQ